MNGTRKVALALSLCLPLALPGEAAPPGDLPFGVYDPDGQFQADTQVTIEHVFLPWEDVNLSSLLDVDQYALARNRALLITIEPWTWTRSERNTARFLRDGIRAGYYDANMRSICSVIGTLQSPISVRWGHEMDYDEGHFIWAGWRPEDYIAAYRRMIDICRDEAPNINVVWSPLGLENATEYYPGDDYVDIVGMSIFGLEPWEEKVLGGAKTFEDWLTERYDRLKGFGKPILVAEVGYSGREAYVNLWENQVRQTRPNMPLLIGSVYFNQPEVYPWRDGFGLPDWRVDKRTLPDNS
ncbi:MULTISPECIES: glycoside hydrolase family 26 protein [Tabrizicola]|uniref:glycoside hydrolase family 26 protein n=1 Tax=Tabrizicola TaxID=1443919 RepID=UPI0010803AA7|nr:MULTISPECIES: glycosyl hydrolase [Paracoccaceae]